MRAITWAAVLLLGSATAATAQMGRWVTESGNLEIEIAPCEQELCGTVVKVLANHSMSQPGVEMPESEKPAIGLKVLSGFTADGDGAWEGQIFNRENGKTYSCVLRQLDAEHLEVRPYIGIHLIGKKQVWRRAAAAG